MKEKSIKCYGALVMGLLIVLILLPTSLIIAQDQQRGNSYQQSIAPVNSNIKWYSPEEAYELNKTAPKPFFIDVYTDWCGWCKRMDATTFKDPTIAQYLNAYYYPVKFNAEVKDTINFMERPYWNSQAVYVAAYLKTQDSTIKILNDSLRMVGNDTSKVQAIGARLQQATLSRNQMARNGRRTTHDLARDLMNNQMSYPTFVLLFDSLKQNFPLKGYQKPNQLLSVLTFFAEKTYQQTTNLQAYNTLFAKAIQNNQLEKFNFLSVAEMEQQGKQNKKKSLVLVTNKQTYNSYLMENGTFASEEVKVLLNQFYNVSKVDLYEKDSLTLQGKTFVNQQGAHQLPVALLQNQLTFPSIAVLDENQQLIMKIPGFFLPSDFVPVLHFINEDAYKTKTFAEFKKEFLNRKN